jgi:hypothetical protein
VHEVITIPARFRGPSASANGGYSAGTLARHIEGAAEVTLRLPVPIEKPLDVTNDDERLVLLDGDDLVAEATATELDIDAPPPIAFDDAVAMNPTAMALAHPERHPFPECFACGPQRAEGDGLRLFPARVPGSQLYAVPWVPNANDVEIVWAALDCPSSGPLDLEDDPPPHVLGRIAGRIDRVPELDAPHVILSWPVQRDGRKLFTGVAIYGPDGDCCASARATWIQLA